MTIDTLVQQLWTVREQKKALAAQDKALGAQYDDLKRQLIALLDEQGVNGAKTSVARVHITESQGVQLIDWDTFCQYVKEHDAFHLLQKRPSATALKELTTLEGAPPPGVNLITLRDLTLTASR